MRTRVKGIITVGLMGIALVCLADSAEAIITDVNILPEEPTINDVITIITHGVASNSPVWIDGSDFDRQGNLLQLDIFLHTGLLPTTIPYSHSENIGTLPSGLYDLTVRTFETSDVFISTDTYSMTFEVVPEPATLALLAFGAVILPRRK